MPPAPQPAVPVVVDSVKQYASLPMTRCTYLSIDCPEPLPNWHLGLAHFGLPILLVNLEAVVYGPLGAPPGTPFSSADEIEQLFEAIEQSGLDVVMEEVWLPNFVFNTRSPVTGDVFRVLQKPFSEAAAFQRGRRDLRTVFTMFEEFPESVVFSEQETASIADWWRQNLEAAVETFPKNDNFQLGWKETETPGGAR